jgi:hypothetical protein
MGVVINPNDKNPVGDVKSKKNVWYAVTADGKKIFVGDKKAEDLMRQGHCVMLSCRKKDL